MKSNKICIAVIAALISINSYSQTVDEIVDKHVAAMGGFDKLNSVKTIVTELSVAINGMEIPSKTQLVVGKSLRSESTIMGNAMVMAVSDSKGWMIRPTMMGGTGEPEDMPSDELNRQISQLDPFGGLVNYKEKGNTVELVGKEKVDKKDAFHIKLTSKDGRVMDEFLDANTYLVSKVKTSINGQEGELNLSDYKEVEGIKFPYTLDMTNQMGTLSIITNKVTINNKLDDAIFKRPVK